MRNTELQKNPNHIGKSEFFPDFQIIPPDRRTETLISRLTEVWESSVRSTHLFLSEEEIRRISGFVPRALREIPHLIALRDEQKELAGFMGIGQGKLEMLFLAPDVRGLSSEDERRYRKNETCLADFSFSDGSGKLSYRLREKAGYGNRRGNVSCGLFL